MAEKITQKDIAQALDISYITVQRALNNSGYVSRELKQKIFDYVRETNYVPHRAAQALVRNKKVTIALFSSDYPDFFWQDIRTGVNIAYEQIRALNYEVAYHTIPEYRTDVYCRRLQEMIDQGVDAVALPGQSVFDTGALFDILDRNTIPYITFNIDAPESNRMGYVGPCYQDGGRLAAEFIGTCLQVKPGARVGIISNEAPGLEDSSQHINRQRLEGFLNNMHTSFPRIYTELLTLCEETDTSRVEEQLSRFLRDHATRLDALYLIPPYNYQLFHCMDSLELSGRLVTVVHDLVPHSEEYFERNLLSAVIYQNPILQGYYAVKILEHVLENGSKPVEERVPIVHNLVLKENRTLFRNHYLFTQLMGTID